MVVQTAPTTKLATRLTYEQYRALPENGNRYEVVQGELLMTAAPLVSHQRILRNLFSILDKHIAAKDWGEVFFAPIEIYLGDEDFVQPDLVCVAKSRLEIVKEKNIVGAPDLVVEILSPSTARTDRVLKMNTYARHHVPHYWIVDPAAQTLEAFEWDQGAYRLSAARSEEEVFAPTLFPDLTIHLAELWK
jgi:Uma2 family endonuclease